MRKPRAVLQKKCKSMKISGQGSKSDIVSRLLPRLLAIESGINPPPNNVTPDRQSRVHLQRRMQYRPPNTSRGRQSRRNAKGSRVAKKLRSPQSTSSKRAATKSKRKKSRKSTILTLQFIGIRIPEKWSNIKYPLGPDSAVTSLVAKSGLTGKSAISDLKAFIRRTYLVKAESDILILFSNVVISGNNTAKLRDFGITNYSLLTLAVIKSKRKCPPFHHQHIARSLRSTTKSMKNGTEIGLDIVTQDDQAVLYRMPVCGHLMSRESLYHYACSVFTDPSSVYLRCPHSKPPSTANTSKWSKKWSCPQCTYLNPNILRCGKRTTQCSMCHFPRERTLSAPPNQCGVVWHYSLIKRILVNAAEDEEDRKENYDDFDFAKLEALSARNTLQSDDDGFNHFNVQKCSECSTVHFKYSKAVQRIHSMDVRRKLSTKCSMCAAHFCWNCGRRFDRGSGHICDGDDSSKREITRILGECPAKRVGSVVNVPSIRACPNPNCGQLINHLEACKHMKCGSCKLDFCFVCLKPKVDAQWQCGSYDARCPVAPRQTLLSVPWSRVETHLNLKKSFQLF